ncbi:MAG: tRNA (adenosine(37)-N6)-threonylcarbamoyltransferase complex dimerization subunit type 1 TsaB [Arenicellales bacterium WSBS_2016_MAG_OTU3]
MNILALDTATELSSVAVFNGVQTFNVESGSRTQSHALLEMVQQQLERASLKLNEINLIVYDQGPGSFTGMRIATGVAQGLGYGLDIAVIGISSLLAMAYASGAKHTAVAIDARMSEVYFGCYKRNQKGEMQPLCDENVLLPESVKLPASAADTVWATAGTGWSVYESEMQTANSEVKFQHTGILYPQADVLVELALAHKNPVPNHSLPLPSYIRNKVARKAGEK